MSYILNQEVINPYGICLGEDLPREHYNPYVSATHSSTLSRTTFAAYQGLEPHHSSIPDRAPTFLWSIFYREVVENYVRRVYNLSDDIEISSSFGARYNNRNSSIYQQPFETEAEAVEYAENLNGPSSLFSLRHNSTHFTATWREQYDGVWVDRQADLRYTGDDVELYTINDYINFWASFFEITPEEFRNTAVHYSVSSQVTDPDQYPEPALDCEPYIKATIVDVNGPTGAIEIDVHFDGSSISDDVTVTVIDGDPVISNTMIENGDGSVTIADNGNINMSNDGGTFYLNEFGNVGFYANGDASLTADNQVQLGVGGTTLTIDSDGFTFRDSTGTVSFTADELNRMRNLVAGSLPE